MLKILIIGNGAREHAIVKSIEKSSKKVELYAFISAKNPGILELIEDYKIGGSEDIKGIKKYTEKIKPDIAIIGPEAPLAMGVVDELNKMGVSCFGPDKDLAQIETSKSFARELLIEYNIPAYPKFRIFSEIDGASEFIKKLDEQYVVKPDGLTGGKGVRVSGDHFKNIDQGLEYIEEVLNKDSKLVIEEKLIGQEFSLQSFCDGKHLVHMPVVQDHKRALVGDKGPNTGGMGSYSCSDHSLPFLNLKDVKEAQKINEDVAKALYNKFDRGYKGILYGGFIATKDGVKLIEYNARFGDPEAMNVLALLKTDFVNICEAVVSGDLDKLKVEFENKATVCKYIVPEGYPDNPIKDKVIDLSEVKDKDMIYYAAVDQKDEGLYLTGSRAIALVGVVDELNEAEKIVEGEIKNIKGPLFHREDIGTEELVNKRVEMMKEVRND